MKTEKSRKWITGLGALALAAGLAGTASARADEVLVDGDMKTFRAGRVVDESALKGCELQARRLGDGTSARIDDRCFADYLDSAPFHASRQSADGLSFVSGYRNILFIRTRPAGGGPPARRMVAGKLSGLTDIRSVSLDSRHGEVFVLDAQIPSVVAFPLDRNGNVYPSRKLASASLEGASSITVDPAHDELIVVNAGKAAIQVYARLANVNWPNPENTTEVLRSLQGPATRMVQPQSAALDSKRGELFVADRDGNQILVFDRRAQGDTAPLRIIRGAKTLLQNPVSVSYLARSDEIVAINGDGSVKRFSRAADGDVAPASGHGTP